MVLGDSGAIMLPPLGVNLLPAEFLPSGCEAFPKLSPILILEQ